MSRTYDIVLYGATGFTGKLVAEYFARSVKKDFPAVRWALAGRNPERLEEVKRNLVSINPACSDVDVIFGSSDDPSSLEALASKTKVVLSTAGPFAKYGSPLVEACVNQKTHYCDITGESPWVKSMIDKHHERAEKDGTLIISMCGFDSVPSDLGTLFCVQTVREKYGVGCKKVEGVATMKGSFSGGTFASILNLLEVRPKGMGNPYLLNPPDTPEVRAPTRRRDLTFLHYNSTLRTWTVPFVMAGVNNCVVRRSSALLAQKGKPYGTNFEYRESAKTSGLISGFFSTMLLGIVGGILFHLASLRLTWLVYKLTPLPKPGEGPSKEVRDKGWFKYYLVGEPEGAAGKGKGKEKAKSNVVVSVSGGDPGYDETAKMLSNAALTLALDRDQLPRGGVLTPAVGLGEPFLRRLQNAGIRFQIESQDKDKEL